MRIHARSLIPALAAWTLAATAQEPVVFRSDVSLVRVDAQVLDRGNRALTGLRMEDFVLTEEGRQQPIRNFSSENTPADVLLLLDVSGSMKPHLQRISAASHDALRALGEEDRVAIMVFDRATRARLPFRNSRGDVERELESLLRQETFDGGTDITRALLDAAQYIGREGRRDARRAIVIVTDDQTERNRDEDAVSRALTRSDTVLSALLAPDAVRNRQSWPGSGGGSGWPDIILGRRGRYPGGGGPVMTGPRTQPAGTAEIARRSGGDSMPADDASAFQDTLTRLRQRYALFFYLPDGVRPGQERNIEVTLSDAARRRYPGAEVRSRRSYLAPGEVTLASSAPPPGVTPATPSAAGDAPPVLKRRPAIDEPGGWRASGTPAGAPAAEPRTPQPSPQPTASEGGGWRRVEENTGQGGWRRVKPGEVP